MKLKESVIGAKHDEADKFPNSVIAAIACSNYYSALEILEKHVVKKDRTGMPIFDRELFSLLQVLALSRLRHFNNTVYLAFVLQLQRLRKHSGRLFAYHQQFGSVSK